MYITSDPIYIYIYYFRSLYIYIYMVLQTPIENKTYPSLMKLPIPQLRPARWSERFLFFFGSRSARSLTSVKTTVRGCTVKPGMCLCCNTLCYQISLTNIDTYIYIYTTAEQCLYVLNIYRYIYIYRLLQHNVDMAAHTFVLHVGICCER